MNSEGYAGLWIAGIATVIVALMAAVPACRQGMGRKATGGALVLLALLSFFRYVYFPPFLPWDVRPVNLHDFTHYYMGAKYFPELGYGRIYSCLSEALGTPPELPVRDLQSKHLSTARQVQDNAPCRPHFSEPRWQSFQQDTLAFLGMLGPAGFNKLLRDHGFNPPPTWVLAAAPVANAVSPDPNKVMALGMIDVTLLAIAIGMVAWGFGIVPAAIAVIVLTTLPAAAPQWTIGSLLRWDWLLALASSAALLARGFPGMAGGALGLAIALRIFPVVSLGALAGFLAFQRLVRRQAISPDWQPFGVGVAASGTAMLALAAMAFGLPATLEFLANLSRHEATASLNEMGLRTALSFAAAALSTGQTADVAIVAKKSQVLALVAPFYLALAGSCFYLLAREAGRIPAWALLVLGVLFIPMGWQEISNYYYQFWFVAALLTAWQLRFGILFLAGNFLMLLTTAKLGAATTMASFAAQSALACGLALSVALILWQEGRKAGQNGALPQPAARTA